MVFKIKSSMFLPFFLGLVVSLTQVECHIKKFEGVFEEFESRKLDLIAKIISDSPIILDAGGYHGADAIHFSKKWPGAKILSFEPNPTAYQVLLKKTAMIPNIHPYPLALNDYNGKALFYVCHGSTGKDPAYEGASSLLEPSDYMQIYYQGPKIEVPCMILDDWCKENYIDHIDFLSLILEGAEFQVIYRSPNILDTVKVIQVQTNFQEFRKGMTQYSALKTFLEDTGFKLLSHWYLDNYQGSAIFVSNECYELAF